MDLEGPPRSTSVGLDLKTPRLSCSALWRQKGRVAEDPQPLGRVATRLLAWRGGWFPPARDLPRGIVFMRPGPACPRNGGARPGPSWSDCHPLLCSPVRERLPRSKQPQVQGLLLLTGMGLAGGSRALHVSHSPPGARGLAGASEADAQPLDPWQEESEASPWEELPTHRQEAWMWGRRSEPGRTLPVPWLSCQFAPSWGGGASVPKHGGVGTPGPREGLLPARGWARGREQPPRSSGCPGRKGGGPLAGRSRGPAGGAWGGDRQQKSDKRCHEEGHVQEGTRQTPHLPGVFLEAGGSVGRKAVTGMP